jgi:glycosyltransferase involved in cell wall biosynthesis
MRILELGKFYPPHRGGMESSLELLCRGLVRRGHEVRVLVAADDRHASAQSCDGVHIRRLSNWGEVRSVPMLPSLFGALRSELRDHPPDVLHLHLPHPLGMWATRWLARSERLMITYHSDIVRQRWLAKSLAHDRQKVLARASRIHVSSEALLQESVDLSRHRSRCEAIPFGVEIEKYREHDPLRHQRWTDRLGQHYALCVGRLVYYKGVDVLLEALRETTIPLVVVGDGPLRTEWETLARVLGLEGQVHFVGEISAESLRALYQGARLFVLPSQERSETFGLVQLEAMAAGCPIVVCRASGGVASVHEEGRTAVMVPPHDVDALREAVVDLWEDEARRRDLSHAALDRVRAFFDAGRSVDRIEALLAQVASGSSTAP